MIMGNRIFWVCWIYVVSLTAGRAQDCLPVTAATVAGNPAGIGYYNCVDVSGRIEPSAVAGSANYDIVSSDRVTVWGESVVRPGTGAATRLLVDIPPVRVSRISPATGSVPRYEKLEFGLGLPPEAEKRISNFVGEVPGLPKLNPFDPADVDIRAEFQQQEGAGWTVKGRQYGFYYRGYVLDTSGASVNWHRNEQPVAERFRVRYAPPAVGEWRVKFTVFLNEVGNYVTPYVYFTVGASENPGYVKVAPGGKYFELGGAPFYPIGQNQPFPECVSEYCMDMGGLIDSPNAQWSVEPWTGNKSAVKSYLMYHLVLKRMKAGGANYFRMLINQWGFEIEFEKLNNYHDRMEQAWEMDRLMDKARELGLYMTWNMTLHTCFEDGNVNDLLHWDFPVDPCTGKGWCYAAIPGVEKPVDLLTDATAKRHFKNRLRYLVARYGYSTNIALMELVSEINNIGQGYVRDLVGGDCVRLDYIEKPYDNLSVIVQRVYNWQVEMLNHIKSDLGHTEHLTGVSYTGEPKSEDLIYSSPLVDYIGLNHYTDFLDRFVYMHHLHNKYRNELGFDKPLFTSELGAAPYLECDNRSEWAKNIWISPFTGFAGSGMSWAHMYHKAYPYMQVYGHLNAFMQGVDFRDASGMNWVPVADVRNDRKSETYAMTGGRSTNRQALGVVVNRSYNYFTMASGPPCSGLTSTELAGLHFVPFNMSPLSVAWETAPNRLKLPGMGGWRTYTLDWYNCLNGQWLGQTEKTSDILGDLYLEHPLLTGDSLQPLVAYKIRPKSMAGLLMVDSIPVASPPALQRPGQTPPGQAMTETVSVYLYPNPATDHITVALPRGMEGTAWRLTDLPGSVRQSGTFAADVNSLSLQGLEPGIYFLTIFSKDNIQVFKLIKL